MIKEKYLHSKKETHGVFFGHGSISISSGVSGDGSKSDYPVVVWLTDESENPKPIGFSDGIPKTSNDIKSETVTLFFKNEEGLDVLIGKLIQAKSYFSDVDHFNKLLTQELKKYEEE